jgi:hypothetical protein
MPICFSGAGDVEELGAPYRIELVNLERAEQKHA